MDRGAPLRVPEVLVEPVDAPPRGQLDSRAGVEHTVRHPAEGSLVAAAVELERSGRARGVAHRADRIDTLHAELIALHAEHVVQREAAGHRKAILIAGMAEVLAERVGTAGIARGRRVVAAARVMHRRRDLGIAPGLVDAQRADHVRELPAFVVVRLGAETELARQREVYAALTTRRVLGQVVALRPRPAVLERQRRRETVAE